MCAILAAWCWYTAQCLLRPPAVTLRGLRREYRHFIPLAAALTCAFNIIGNLRYAAVSSPSAGRQLLFNAFID